MPADSPGPAAGIVAGTESSHASERHVRGLLAVLVTYKRPKLLHHCLRELARQPRIPDRLIVVDNDPLRAGEAVVARWHSSTLPIEYLPATDNLGPAGGFNLGIEAMLSEARDDDFVALLDDNDPVASIDVLGELARFLDDMLTRDPATAGVGTRGSPFDYRRALSMPVPRARLCGPIRVDQVTGDGVPLYLAGALRRAGGFDPRMFFGFEELELGLRFRDAGQHLYLHGDLANAILAIEPHRESSGRSAAALDPISFRRYYCLRNLLFILQMHGHRATAWRVALLRGICKPIANLLWSPRLAVAHLRLNLTAISDARAGRLGRTLDPDGY